jgi:hypothetical protein
MSTKSESPAAAGRSASAPQPTSHLLLPAPQDERHDGWTPERQAVFLRELAATHCVSTAARAVGMSRQSAYKLRHRLQGEPFDIAWSCAFRRLYDALAEMAVERAINGVEVPHFYKGELIHTSRRFDERATVALLALRPEIAPLPLCRPHEQSLYPEDDFERLVGRVEHGDELWADIDYLDDESEGE